MLLRRRDRDRQATPEREPVVSGVRTVRVIAAMAALPSSKRKGLPWSVSTYRDICVSDLGAVKDREVNSMASQRRVPGECPLAVIMAPKGPVLVVPNCSCSQQQ